MDLFEELERMVQNAASDSDSEVFPDEIARWQRLFYYSHALAASLIADQKVTTPATASQMTTSS
jgi:hypothetical protein